MDSPRVPCASVLLFWRTLQQGGTNFVCAMVGRTELGHLFRKSSRRKFYVVAYATQNQRGEKTEMQKRLRGLPPS